MDPVNVVVQYWSPAIYGGGLGFWGGPFGGFPGSGLGGFAGFGDPFLTLAWTPNGYNPCAFGCGGGLWVSPAPITPPPMPTYTDAKLAMLAQLGKTLNPLTEVKTYATVWADHTAKAIFWNVY